MIKALPEKTQKAIKIRAAERETNTSPQSVPPSWSGVPHLDLWKKGTDDAVARGWVDSLVQEAWSSNSPCFGSHSVLSQCLIIKPQLDLGETHVYSIEEFKK